MDYDWWSYVFIALAAKVLANNLTWCLSTYNLRFFVRKSNPFIGLVLSVFKVCLGQCTYYFKHVIQNGFARNRKDDLLHLPKRRGYNQSTLHRILCPRMLCFWLVCLLLLSTRMVNIISPWFVIRSDSENDSKLCELAHFLFRWLSGLYMPRSEIIWQWFSILQF